MGVDVVGIELEGPLEMGDGLVPGPGSDQGVAEVVLGLGERVLRQRG